MKKFNKNSFSFRLMTAFLFISIVPIIFISIFAYRNTAQIVGKNVDELTRVYLSQTAQSVKSILSSYEDLSYQIYTDESAAKLAVKIDNNDNYAVSKNQLLHLLRGYAYVKPYVESITVITKTGEVIHYDMLTAATTKISWLDNFGISKEELFQTISNSNDTGVLTSQYAVTMGNISYYMFHLTHRIIDYRYINQKEAVLIISINEKLLDETCNGDNIGREIPTSVNFIVDKEGRLVSFPDEKLLGLKVVNFKDSKKQQDKTYQNLVANANVLTSKYVSTHTLYDEALGWTFVTVSNQSSVISSIRNQQQITGLIVILSSVTLIILIIVITSYLTKSIGKVVKAMKVVEQGKLSVRVEADKNMPTEVAIIAEQFNHMLEWLRDSMENEKKANMKQKNAEIAALEAQINPHFLYNTLDTINWMAIDNNQYEISNTIGSLAHILRYSIDKSNTSVEISKEVEWLKQYVFLQQTRLKNIFECNMHIEPEVLNYHIHKLLLQPFVENAILHGFEGTKRKHILDIDISLVQDKITIIIQDNGKGMPSYFVDEINMGNTIVESEKCHIGIKNAVERLKMYYSDSCEFRLESKLEVGTKIIICIPKT